MAGPAPAPSDGGTPSKRRRTGDGGESRPASAGAGAGARAALAPKSATKKGDPDAVPDAPAPLGAYMQREAFLAAAEAAGDLSFEYVRNDGDPVNSMWLIGLKQVFSRQLPNMPKEYIARLVFDRRHASVAIVRRDGGVVGGVTYRLFPEASLGEIAFCAVSANEQVKGYGTRLMNHTKAAAATRDGVTHFLTYADNNAVGYFAKQGFSATVTLDKGAWRGRIKDYDGGTLMECVLDPRYPYTALAPAVAAARAAVDARVRAVSDSHVVHPGLAPFRGGGDGHPVPPASIPGVAEAGWAAQAAAEPVPRVLLGGKEWARLDGRGVLPRFAGELVSELATHEDAWPFQSPVDARDVPDYYQVVKRPMDFETLQTALAADAASPKTAFHVTLDLVVADLRLIFSNAKLYNGADTVYYKAAARLEAALDAALAARVTFGDAA